jgi:fumarate hydratase subunit beta
MAEGLKGMMGKGMRSREVKDAMKLYKAMYLGTIGGAGTLISSCIKKVDVVAYDDLGSEALRRIEVQDFPATVINDIYGGDLYEEGQVRFRINQYRQSCCSFVNHKNLSPIVQRCQSISCSSFQFM